MPKFAFLTLLAKFSSKNLDLKSESLTGWLYRGLTQIRSYHGGQRCTYVSWLSHTRTNTTFLSKASDYFSHRLLQRWEAKICRKGGLPQPGIELTKFPSTGDQTHNYQVRHTHHLAIRADQKVWPSTVLDTTYEKHGYPSTWKLEKCFNPIFTVWNCYASQFGIQSMLYDKHNHVFVCHFTLSQTSPGFYVSVVQVFWKHCGKRRNCS